MKLWLIERTDECDWDETCAIVVRAETADDARAHALADDGGTQFKFQTSPYPVYVGFHEDNITVTELTPEGEPGLIIKDFLHG
jgi:hypothetical protein